MKSFHFLQPIKVQSFPDERGKLGVSDFGNNPKFTVRRLYYITDVPAEVSRGAHGHKKLEQVLYALKGSFRLSVTDGDKVDEVLLDEMSDGFYVPGGLWRKLDEFTNECVCLVLASLPYDKNDYIFDFDKFKEWRRDQ